MKVIIATNKDLLKLEFNVRAPREKGNSIQQPPTVWEDQESFHLFFSKGASPYVSPFSFPISPLFRCFQFQDDVKCHFRSSYANDFRTLSACGRARHTISFPCCLCFGEERPSDGITNKRKDAEENTVYLPPPPPPSDTHVHTNVSAFSVLHLHLLTRKCFLRMMIVLCTAKYAPGFYSTPIFS